MNVLEFNVNNLRVPPPSRQVEVSVRLPLPGPETTGLRRAALHATAGCMAGEEGENFERAVRETADPVLSR